MAPDKSNPDWAWRLELTALVAGVKANQDNMHEKLDKYIDASQKQLDRLDKSVYGLNGTPGLHEEVRSMKGKWAVVYGLFLIVVSAFVNYAVDNAFASKGKPIEPAVQMAAEAVK